MPISVIALVLNVAAGIGVWSGEWSLAEKIVLTGLLVGKYALFFWAVWMAEERGRRNGVAVCSIANFAIAVYAFSSTELMVSLAAAVMLFLLAVWKAAVICENRISKVLAVCSAAVFLIAVLLSVIFFDQIQQYIQSLIPTPGAPGCFPGEGWK